MRPRPVPRLFVTAVALACATAPGAFAAAPAPPPAAAVATGRIVLSEPEFHRVEVFAPSGTLLARIPTGVGPRGLAARAGTLFVADRGTERAPGSSITVIDLARLVAERTIAFCEGCAPRAVAVGEAGTLWVAALAPPMLWRLDPPYAHAAAGIPLEQGGTPVRLAVVASGAAIAVGTRGGTSLLLVDPRERRAEALDIGLSPEAVAARPGTAQAWSVTSQAGRLVTVDVAPGTTPRFSARPAPGLPQDLAFTPNGTLLVTAARERVLVAIDPADGHETGRVVFPSTPRDIAPSPDGTRAAVFLPEQGSVAIAVLGPPLRIESTFAVEPSVAELLWVP